MVKVSACKVNKNSFEHVMQCDFRNTEPWTLSLGLYSFSKEKREGSIKSLRISSTWSYVSCKTHVFVYSSA